MALDIADLARRAAELGGSEAVASVSIRRELVVRAGPHGAVMPPRRTFDVLVRLLIRDGAGRLGAARCSTSTSDAQLRSLADRAHDAAGAAPFNLGAFPVVEQGPGHDGFDLLTADLDPAASVATAIEAAASIGYDRGADRTALWRGEDVEWAVATAQGTHAHDRRTGAALVARSVDADGHVTGYAQASAATADRLDAIAVGLAATPAAVPLDRRGGPLLATPGAAVVLLPAALAPLLEALARVACTGHAHAIGSSPFTGRLGTAVAPPCVTLTDDPGHPGTLPRAIDVEGSPAAPVTLIHAGVEHDVVHDTTSGDEIGAASTGHAAELGGSPAGPLPRNLVLEPGDGTTALGLGLDAQAVVIPRIEQVVLAGPGSSRFSAVGRAAYVVDAGDPVRLLGDVFVAGDLTTMLEEVGALTATAELVATLDRLPERTTATYCPAAVTRGLSILVA